MMSSSTLSLSGIFPPIVTPFDLNGCIDFDCLQTNLIKWNEFTFKGYVVLGSNGECPFLSAEEKLQLVAFVKKFAKPDKLIIAGSGCESTRETVELTRKMASVGADAVLVVTPSFYKNAMTDAALKLHYRTVADSSPVPVILYNVPANTGIELSAEAVIRLSSHPNIIGVKDSGGNIAKIGHMIERTKQSNFQVIAGSAGFLLPALTLGAVGGICALANVLGEEVCDLYDMYKKGDIQSATNLQRRLIAPNTAVTQKFGVAGLKQAMDWRGLYGGPVRAPLVPLTDDLQHALRNTFVTAGFTL